MRVKTWLSFILVGENVRLAFGGSFDWEFLKDQVKGPEWKSVVKLIVENWSARPDNFFQGIEGDSWQKIIPFLPLESIATVKPKEFEQNPPACQAFAKYLPIISNVSNFPEDFRHAVYKILCERKLSLGSDYNSQWIENNGVQAMELLDLKRPLHHRVAPPNPQKSNLEKSFPALKAIQLAKKSMEGAIGLISYIPVEWVRLDGPLLMQALVTPPSPSQLSLLREATLVELFKNPGGNLCTFITLDALESLDREQLEWMTPDCMSAIKGLEEMNLSNLLSYLPNNVFATFNGSLTRPTIEQLSGHQLEEFGSLIDGETLICTKLELAHLSPTNSQFLTARCLHGYLSSIGGDREQQPPLDCRWEYFNFGILLQFTPKMQSVWANISSHDFNMMPSSTRRLIMSTFQACQSLDLTRLSPVALHDLSAPCLYAILSNPERPIRLGSLWQSIPASAIFKFTDEMLKVLKNVAASDFYHMGWSTLQVILRSEAALTNLPKPIERIIISSLEAKKLSITSKQFAFISKVAPNLAGQLLLLVSNLPNDILADCDGNVVRTLTFITAFTETDFDWKYVLSQMGKRVRNFERKIALMSSRTRVHFCSTINGIEEYLSLPWLRENMNEACRLQLPFNLDDFELLLGAPELIKDVIPWEGMLRQYNLQDWTLAFKNKHLVQLTSDCCEFWEGIIRKGRGFLEAIGPEILHSIRPHCIYKLRNVLAKNGDLIGLLAGDAFSMFQVEELPCQLEQLFPNQIEQLSKFTLAFTFDNVDGEVDFRDNRLVVTSSIMEELEFLNGEQLKMLFTSPWIFFSDEVVIMALELLVKSTSDSINKLFTLDDNLPLKFSNKFLYGLDKYPSLTKPLEGVFDLFALIGRDQDGIMNCQGLDSLILAIKNSPLRMLFTAYLLGDALLSQVASAFVTSPEELFYSLQNSSRYKTESSGIPLTLTFDDSNGFDRTVVKNLLLTFPRSFLNSRVTATVPTTTLSNTSNNLIGGDYLTRMLVSQLLEDIDRDLLLSGLLATEPNQNDKPNSFGFNGNGGENEHGGIAVSFGEKFIWGISREAGFIVGLVIAKALQMRIRLPFLLDPNFYKLIVDKSDLAVEEYYWKSFYSNMADPRNSILLLGGKNFLLSSKAQIQMELSKLDSIQFISLRMDSKAPKIWVDSTIRVDQVMNQIAKDTPLGKK